MKGISYKALRKLKSGKAFADPGCRGLRFIGARKGVYAQFRYKDPTTGKWVSKGLGRLPDEDEFVEAAVEAGRSSLHLDEAIEHFRREVGVIKRKLRAGVDPRLEAGADGLTLGQALELHAKRARNAGRSERTIEFYRKFVDRYMADWLDVPLRKLSRGAVRERHAHIANRGKYAANGAMRALRAIWNTARKEDEQLGESPTIAVAWFEEIPRGVELPPEELPAWWEAVQSIANPVRRDFYVFVLFTGLRRSEAASLTWANVNLKRGTARIPTPKGGAKKAFTLPLSDFLIDLLKGRREYVLAAAQAADPPQKPSPWVFPAASRSGHIEEPKATAWSNDGKPRRKVRLKELPSPHALRHTFIAVAEGRVGIPLGHVKALVNHSLPRDITLRYGAAHEDTEGLRGSMQLITDYLRTALAPKPEHRADPMGDSDDEGTVVPLHA